MSPEQVIAVYAEGWDAMEWLARHAKAGQCRECANYHQRVSAGGNWRDLLRFRCRLAQVQYRKYMAVIQMRQNLNDDFDCDLGMPGQPCTGRAEWALVERMTPRGRYPGRELERGRLVGFQVGCEGHVRLHEARAVAAGKADRFTIEKLEDVVREGADKMR
jgi:hypothetical protein